MYPCLQICCNNLSQSVLFCDTYLGDCLEIHSPNRTAAKTTSCLVERDHRRYLMWEEKYRGLL